MTRAPVVQARDLWFAYDDGTEALRGAELTLQPGEFVALIGPNGSGKTTLAKHLLGLLRPDRGQVRMDGAEIAGRSVGELARTVGYVFQNPDHQLFGANVEQELSLGPRQLNLPEDEIRERVEGTTQEFGLSGQLDRPVGSLSYGQRKRLSLAAVATMRPPVLVLDEPTSGLHWQAARQLLDWLAERTRDGGSVLVITHDMRLVAEYAVRAALMMEGRIVAEGSPFQIFDQETLLKRTGLEAPQIARLARRLSLPVEAVTVAAACEAYLGAHG